MHEPSNPCYRLAVSRRVVTKMPNYYPANTTPGVNATQVRHAMQIVSGRRMDLSLHGSQVNLASRHKPKATSVKYPSLKRPCSANVSRHSRPFSLVRRPMSADDKLARSLKNCVKFSEQVMSEEQLWKSKKFISGSSSNIFKLLLEEPIDRSYRPQDSESLSDSSLGQKICVIASKQGQVKGSDSSESDGNVGGRKTKSKVNSMAEQQVDRRSGYIPDTTSSTLNNAASNTAKSSHSKLTHVQNKNGDFWHDTKPDLPGRVSFGAAETYDPTVYGFDDLLSADISTSTKKYVHFKESEDKPDPNESQNGSSASTCESNETFNVRRNSSATSNCRCPFACSSSGYISVSENESNTNVQESNEKSETNLIIEEYKKEIAESASKVDIDLMSSHIHLSPKSSTDRLISNYQKLANEIFDDIQADLVVSSEKSIEDFADEPSDLSVAAKSTKTAKSKINSSSEQDEKSDNSTDSSLKQFDTLRNFQESSSTVIKNYLRASEIKSTPSQHRKIKENNIGANKAENKSGINRRTKSANTSTLGGHTKTAVAMKKTPSYSCLRQDSNLDEFQIEKVDSWMSLHDSNHDCIVSPDADCSDRKTKNQKTTTDGSGSRYKNSKEVRTKSPEDSSQDDSTYEEIVSVIKEIEEDKRKETTASNADIHLKLQSTSSSPDPESLATRQAERDSSPDKYRDILHYLDNVESSCDKTIMETRRSIPESSRSEIEFAVEPDIAEDVPKIADLLMLPNHQLARRVVALSLRANELANAIQLSKQHVAHVRLERQKVLRQEKSTSSNRLKEQKKYFENIVTRHQGFIEQLLRDKGSLCEKVAALTRRIESQNQAWEHKLETELARAKETALAGEKIRREKWIRENTKKIKELTVKGLEMEINRMSCEHQKQVTELKRTHQQQLLDVVGEERQKYELLEKSIRDSCAQDREKSISNERDAIRERFEKQLREEQHTFDEQKCKLLEEFAMERERLCLEIKQKDIEFECRKQDLLKDKELAVEQVRNELADKCQKQEHYYQTKTTTIQKQFESDFLIWKREFENACKLREVENENAVRQHYRCERDRQIDAIIAKMDSETQRCQEEYELKLSRIKEKYEVELHQTEIAEKQLKEKFHDTRTKLADSEARVQNYQAEVRQLNMELTHSKKMCDKLLDEKEIMKENARREVQQEITTIQTERDNEIERIYQRVQQAIEKKDTAMELLQKDNSTLRERCIKLEAIIRQQRKDYCIK